MAQLKGRMRRIAAKNPSMKKGDVRALAEKRDKAYRANQSRTGLKSGGGKGSIKRAVFRKGTKGDAKALKATAKGAKRIVKANAKAMSKVTGRSRSVTKVEELRSYRRSAKRKAAK